MRRIVKSVNLVIYLITAIVFLMLGYLSKPIMEKQSNAFHSLMRRIGDNPSYLVDKIADPQDIDVEYWEKGYVSVVMRDTKESEPVIITPKNVNLLKKWKKCNRVLIKVVTFNEYVPDQNDLLFNKLDILVVEFENNKISTISESKLFYYEGVNYLHEEKLLRGKKELREIRKAKRMIGCALGCL